jgi:hypothetical protein
MESTNARDLKGLLAKVSKALPQTAAIRIDEEQSGTVQGTVFKAMVTSYIPFNFVENSHLQKALSVFGVEGMTRKHISAKMLDNLSANDQAGMVEKLANEDYPAGSSDGRRKNFCAHELLCPRRQFFSAVGCEGLHRHAQVLPSYSRASVRDGDRNHGRQGRM